MDFVHFLQYPSWRLSPCTKKFLICICGARVQWQRFLTRVNSISVQGGIIISQELSPSTQSLSHPSTLEDTISSPPFPYPNNYSPPAPAPLFLNSSRTESEGEGKKSGKGTCFPPWLSIAHSEGLVPESTPKGPRLVAGLRHPTQTPKSIRLTKEASGDPLGWVEVVHLGPCPKKHKPPSPDLRHPLKSGV